RWRAEAPADERRTVVLRPEYSAVPADAEGDLRRLGAGVETAGPGAIVAAVTPAVLEAVLALPGIRAAEAARVLQPRVPRRSSRRPSTAARLVSVPAHRPSSGVGVRETVHPCTLQCAPVRAFTTTTAALARPSALGGPWHFRCSPYPPFSAE